MSKAFYFFCIRSVFIMFVHKLPIIVHYLCTLIHFSWFGRKAYTLYKWGAVLTVNTCAMCIYEMKHMQSLSIYSSITQANHFKPQILSFWRWRIAWHSFIFIERNNIIIIFYAQSSSKRMLIALISSNILYVILKT